MKPEEAIAVLAAILGGRETGDVNDQVERLAVLLPNIPWADRMAWLDPMMSARPTTEEVLERRAELKELAKRYEITTLHWRPATREIVATGLDLHRVHWFSLNCSQLLMRSVFVPGGHPVASDGDIEL